MMAKQTSRTPLPRIELIDTPSPLASREAWEKYRRAVETAEMPADERDEMLKCYRRALFWQKSVGWND
jgi:hypothetical protein